MSESGEREPASVNKTSRRRVAELVKDDEAGDEPLSGDFPSEGVLDHFRRAEIWVPTEVYADHIAGQEFDWYALRFQVAFLPPGELKMTSARVRLEFREPVSQLDAWSPNDTFSAFRELETSGEIKVSGGLKVPDALLEKFVYLANLLPQVSAEYRRFAQEHKTPMESVLRAVSDRQRRLSYDLAQDPKTGIDPRQLTGEVLLGVPPGTALAGVPPLLQLAVDCRCGLLRLRSEVEQDVDIVWRR
jgi:hypothetical protein